jgi:SAM-dependent methyltransferase
MARAAPRTELPAAWGAYYREAWQRGPTRLVRGALRSVRVPGGRRPRHALDLGCGVGQDAIYLAGRGFEVLAIDQHPGALGFLRDLAVPGVRCRRADLARVRPPAGQYDLVHAALSLPFVGQRQLPITMRRIARALRPGGVLSCHLFGVRHLWNRPRSGLAFVTRDELHELLAGFRIVSLLERQPRPADHWPHHLFEIVARRRD